KLLSESRIPAAMASSTLRRALRPSSKLVRYLVPGAKLGLGGRKTSPAAARRGKNGQHDGSRDPRLRHAALERTASFGTTRERGQGPLRAHDPGARKLDPVRPRSRSRPVAGNPAPAREHAAPHPRASSGEGQAAHLLDARRARSKDASTLL